MSKQIEAMKLALDALEYASTGNRRTKVIGPAITALREAQAEQPAPQQEPVACKTLCELCVKRGYHFCANAAQTTPIPSPPASKPWVGLTDEEVIIMSRYDLEYAALIGEVQRKLKEKNT